MTRSRASSAALTISTLSLGNHQSITAVYSGDINFLTSTSTPPQAVNVSADGTTTTLAGNPPAGGLVFGQPLQITATVAANPPGTGTPTGTLQLTDNGTFLQQASLTNGSATFNLSLPVSAVPHSLVATFLPNNGLFLQSDSSKAALVYTVSADPTWKIQTAFWSPFASSESVPFTARSMVEPDV